MKRAIYPGSFDPFTTGHYAVARRALAFADEVLIAVGTNAGKKTMFTVEERVENIRSIYRGESRIRVASYAGLTADFAKSANVDFILRGVRNMADFEYEKTVADINRELSGMETVILFSAPEYGHVSSSLVRELIRFGKDITNLIPQIK
jgi:pantetheine-phosphate adenylyltransferase